MSSVVLASALFAGVTNAQIVLPPPNLTGTIGLENETFSTASVSASFAGTSRTDALANGEAQFAITVDVGEPFTLTAQMFSFAGTIRSYSRVFHSSVTPRSSFSVARRGMSSSTPSGC